MPDGAYTEVHIRGNNKRSTENPNREKSDNLENNLEAETSEQPPLMNRLRASTEKEQDTKELNLRRSNS